MPKGIYIRTKSWTLSNEQKRAISERQLGERHWNWKGDNVGYMAIHQYVASFKVGICKNCGVKGKTESALKKGFKHEKNPKNYIELCKKCHIAYDRTPEWTEKNKLALSKTYTHTHPIRQITCEHCHNWFIPAKKTRRFCSNSCSAKGCAKWEILHISLAGFK